MTQDSLVREPTPVTILTGFLGSGKTTVLNALLRAPHGRRMAIIVNEFGEVGIDGSLVPGGESFVELDNGCLCCALNEDLQVLLEQLASKPDIDHIVIETTGLADPTPVAWTCTRPQLSQRLRVDAIVTVVDVAHLNHTLAEGSEALLQIKRADLLLLNKLDLVDDDARGAVQLLREHNELAPLVMWRTPEPPHALVLGVHAPARAKSAEAPHNEPEHMPAHGHSHATSFESFTYRFKEGAKLSERAVEDVAFEIPESVYRFKALVRVDADEGPYLLVNGVAGRIDLRFMTPETPPKCSAWVFFGRSLPRQELAALLDTLEQG